MDHDLPRPPNLRERTRQAVREQVRALAVDLFIEQGFDATTTEDVARAAGISPRSFFRYFSTKEDVLISGSIAFGDHVCEALAARPSAESIGISLRRCLDPVAVTGEIEGNLEIVRIIMGTTSLRAHNYEKHLAWEEMMVPIIARRLPEDLESAVQQAETFAHLTMACLDVAMSQWVMCDGAQSVSDLLDRAFSQLAAMATDEFTQLDP